MDQLQAFARTDFRSYVGEMEKMEKMVNEEYDIAFRKKTQFYIFKEDIIAKCEAACLVASGNDGDEKVEAAIVAEEAEKPSEPSAPSAPSPGSEKDDGKDDGDGAVKRIRKFNKRPTIPCVECGCGKLFFDGYQHDRCVGTTSAKKISVSLNANEEYGCIYDGCLFSRDDFRCLQAHIKNSHVGKVCKKCGEQHLSDKKHGGANVNGPPAALPSPPVPGSKRPLEDDADVEK